MLDFADTTMLNPYAPAIGRPKALFFDVNETLLDLNPLTESVARVLDGRRDLAVLWFTSLLHHSLVATVGNHYRDFGQIGVATLLMVKAVNEPSWFPPSPTGSRIRRRGRGSPGA
ncbi:HAD family hydrolase [Methylohalobius crimeensis]|uniref:hypothetical protein n=1 Tax=Methylohalobius crimeensis TaxID=244365 RepID=UPI00126793B1|nr:hypothetical protein [Methylohalobius crimeensis]